MIYCIHRYNTSLWGGKPYVRTEAKDRFAAISFTCRGVGAGGGHQRGLGFAGSHQQHLSCAGGTVGEHLGLLIDMALMLVICRNFSFMASRYPRAGGIYDYTKEVFGYDRAFLVFWFLSLTYISIFWANATSLPLFARFFIGDTFKTVYLFTVFGYEVYLGEALLTLAAIAGVTLLCVRNERAMARCMVVLVCVFTAGIALCFVVAAAAHRGGWAPAFVPEKSAIAQSLRIAFISP